MTEKHKILVLDNDVPRHDIFRAAAGDFELVHTYEICTFAQAVQEVEPPLLISLDHDLATGVNAHRESDECGCDAADLVVEFVPQHVPILIHSANNHCAQVMRRILLAKHRMGRVSRVNIDAVRKDSERAQIAMIREALEELIAAPHWPEDIGPEELVDMLGDDRRFVCPVRVARRR